jgi:Protein of unknown function (DUF2510)
MSEPGGPHPGAAPPGWYPDPDGAPGTVRWWSGTAWSDVTTPAGPGVAVRSSPVLSPPASPPAPGGSAPATAARPARRRLRRAVAAGVVAVVAVVVALLVGRSGGDSSASPGATAPTAPGTAFPPGTVQIVDRDAGISYPYLGTGWYEWDLQPLAETTATAGQYFTTQRAVPGGGEFIASCQSGPLAAGFGWTGPPSLEATATAVADSLRGNYYPAPNQRKVVADEARTVDGHAAWLYEYELSWDVPGYEATGEKAALLLVDVGRATPALLWISIPNTHAELYSVIDGVLDGVHVP